MSSLRERASRNYAGLVSKLEEDKQLLLGVLVVGLFMTVFFACMLGFIDHAKMCFLSPPISTGTASPVPGNMSKTDTDFTIAGDLIASLGLIGGLIMVSLCAVVLKHLYA